MSGKEDAEANSGAELSIKAEDARNVASLHRYAPSRSTTLGLVSPYDAASRSGEPRLALSSRFLQLYPALPHVVLFCMHRSVMNKLRLPDEGEDMQDFASSVPRIYLPRTPVNRPPSGSLGTFYEGEPREGAEPLRRRRRLVALTFAERLLGRPHRSVGALQHIL